jgi:SAM-dependent methyltransferase
MEQDRLAIQHQVFVSALKGKLTTTRVTNATRRILDLGTGPGNWAVAAAQQWPHAEVVGVDMAVWDLETTEAESGGSRVTWELDDLDVWGEESDIEILTARLDRTGFFGEVNKAHRASSSSKGNAKASSSQSHTPLTSEGDLSYDPYVLQSECQPGWHFSEPFDLIHVRNMKGTFASWEEVYTEIYNNLNPGGWVEVADYECVLPEMLHSNQIPGEMRLENFSQRDANDFVVPTMRKLYLAMMEGSFRSGRPLGTYYLHPTYLEDVGFKDVRTTYVNVPVGQWPEDEEQRRVGKLFLVALMECLEAHLLRLMTRYGDSSGIWTVEEVKAQVEQAQKELLEYNEQGSKQKMKEGWCANFKWVIGRKSKNAS